MNTFLIALVDVPLLEVYQYDEDKPDDQKPELKGCMICARNDTDEENRAELIADCQEQWPGITIKDHKLYERKEVQQKLNF